ncbi:unnamed protein product, partial [Meganyctiphanes norvegica]
REKPYQCKNCDKAFSQISHHIQHQSIHTGEKQHQCKLCDMAFSHKASLIYHQRTHTGEKPYQCNTCDRAFSHKSVCLLWQTIVWRHFWRQITAVAKRRAQERNPIR